MNRKNLLHTLWKVKAGRLGILLLLFLVSMSLIGPHLTGYHYAEQHLSFKNTPPSPLFWFGTDDFGRDLFTRVWYGARISLGVGLLAGFIDLFIGMIWGGVAGWFGGKIDECMMRFVDILYSIPYLLIIIPFSVVFGSGLLSVVFSITVIGWITMARIVRGQILVLKEMEYVLAARSMGASFRRILGVHLLPNAFGPIIVTLMFTIPSAIFSEAFLSFLGLGVQAPMASWGMMAKEGLASLQYYPWRLFFPSFFICISMFSFHLIGETLKEMTSPHSSPVKQ